MTFGAGIFTLEITDPAPIWVAIKTDREGDKLRCRHSDLVDLRHVVDRAIAAAERLMPGETA